MIPAQSDSICSSQVLSNSVMEDTSDPLDDHEEEDESDQEGQEIDPISPGSLEEVQDPNHDLRNQVKDTYTTIVHYCSILQFI